MTSAVRTLALMGALAGAIAGQAQSRPLRLQRQGSDVRVRADRVGFITGPVLTRLKDGATVRVVLDLALGSGERGPFTSATQRRFSLSYDLWEERIATSLTDGGARPLPHATVADAEQWCVDQLRVPDSALPHPLPASGLWVRLTHQVEIEETTVEDDGGGLTLRGLVERFSRIRGNDGWRGSIVSGPLRIE